MLEYDFLFPESEQLISSAKRDVHLSWEYFVPDGWRDLFADFCARISSVLENYGSKQTDYLIVDVKEKYGELRVYALLTDPKSSEEINLIDEIEDDLRIKSYRVCFECGKPARYLSKSWILPYCTDCAIALNKEANSRHKTNFAFEDEFTEMHKDDEN